LGAAIGSTLGKLVPGENLLFLFALVMIAAGIAMLRPRAPVGGTAVGLTQKIAIRLTAIGLAAGMLSGFFGIGGGFLIVPGIMFGSGMPILNAIGSSLFSVGTFGLTTAVNYAISGLVDWEIAAEFIAGGAIGGVFGMMAAMRLSTQKRTLNYLFAGVVFTVALYMLARTGMHLFAV
jgi:uncharacterized membrane protein YfcA